MMAQLNYTTSGLTGHDMRTLNFDALVGTVPLSAFNPFAVQWGVFADLDAAWR
jgi:hypothetical protein